MSSIRTLAALLLLSMVPFALHAQRGGAGGGRFGAAATAAPAGEPSWQGNSVAEWEVAGGARGAPRAGNLKVVTTNLKPGYIRRNGAPHSKNAVVTEYYDLNTTANGDRWLNITTKVDDPTYFTRPYITTSDFKNLP